MNIVSRKHIISNSIMVRSFATSVYIWASMPRLGPKASELK